MIVKYSWLSIPIPSNLTECSDDIFLLSKYISCLFSFFSNLFIIRSVVFNLLLTLRILSESFRLESFRIAFLSLLFDFSQWRENSHFPLYLTIVNIFWYSRLSHLGYWALLQHWCSTVSIWFLNDSLIALVVATSDFKLALAQLVLCWFYLVISYFCW